jgi:hypothetical protein
MWSRLLVSGQILGILLALSALAFYPPAAGKMLLIPLTDTAAARIAPLALAGGAALIASGPVHGSLIVSGERGRISSAFANTGILILAAPPAVCGGSVQVQA